jgi:hypothetical protein
MKQLATLFIFTVCISAKTKAQHYLTKINVSDKTNCFVTLVYKNKMRYCWKVLKKDTLKIVHSYQLDSICLKCDGVELKVKLDQQKKKTQRLPLRGDERVQSF